MQEKHWDTPAKPFKQNLSSRQSLLIWYYKQDRNRSMDMWGGRKMSLPFPFTCNFNKRLTYMLTMLYGWKWKIIYNEK